MRPDPCTCPLCGQAVTDLPVTILPERGMVIANGRVAIVTTSEAAILRRLAEVYPRMASTPALMTWMYQLRHGEEPDDKIIDVYICKLRKKLKPLGVEIQTVWGQGYALATPVRPTVVSELEAA